jgi:hypothetical protein
VAGVRTKTALEGVLTPPAKRPVWKCLAMIDETRPKNSLQDGKRTHRTKGADRCLGSGKPHSVSMGISISLIIGQVGKRGRTVQRDPGRPERWAVCTGSPLHLALCSSRWWHPTNALHFGPAVSHLK